jgi:hypothetical protein
MKMKSKSEEKGYEARRVPGRDAHSASEKTVKTQAAGTQSHSGSKKKDK